MLRSPAETFFYNFNESKFFSEETKYQRVKRQVCTIGTPPVDHLKIIDDLYKGTEIYMTLYPQRPGTYFGATICKCRWEPEGCRGAAVSQFSPSEQPEAPKDENSSSPPPSEKALRMKSENAGNHDTMRKTQSEPVQGSEYKNKKKPLRMKNQDTDDPSPPPSRTTFGFGSRSQPQNADRSQPQNADRSQPQNADRPQPQNADRSQPPAPAVKKSQPKVGDGLPDHCRKCTEKLCLKCRMPVDCCCCGIPNFLYCQTCEADMGSSKHCGDPFKCRKCDQSLCLVCRQHVDCCCCPKPNFFVCRTCETRRRTRCCIPVPP